ncbi:MAG: addiction module protein [Bacteroidales bacterium]|nr:addiction module protein [Bacteroidales bacterium]
MDVLKDIYQRSLKLRPAERLQLIEMIAESLNNTDEENQSIWKEEAEQRYLALENKKVRTFSLDEIIARYKE